MPVGGSHMCWQPEICSKDFATWDLKKNSLLARLKNQNHCVVLID